MRCLFAFELEAGNYSGLARSDILVIFFFLDVKAKSVRGGWYMRDYLRIDGSSVFAFEVFPYQIYMCRRIVPP